MQQIVNGVEVYEVGKQQFLDWCESGNLTKPEYASNYIVCDTYVIVMGDVSFRGMRTSVTVWPGYWTLDEAISKLPPAYVDMQPRYGIDFRFCRELEVWHIVDDGDLWQAWDSMSECAAITGEVVTCLQDVWRLQDGYIPTWLDPIIENVKGQSIRDYGYEPVKCSICGDDDFGPWVRLDVPLLGMRYFCECCEGEAKQHGARYVAA